MRALMFCALVACTPDIGSGNYLCGPEQACPPEYACDGATNACISPSVVTPFACDASVVHDDDTATTATPLPATLMDCVSPIVTTNGCLASGDSHNWYSFTVPMNCVAVEIEARVSFPDAFEPLGMTFGDATGATLGMDTACKASQASTGDDVRCFTMMLTPGQTYTLAVTPAGGLDCDGKCAFNRYELDVQLATPG
jgi:hypothetical protein